MLDLLFDFFYHNIFTSLDHSIYGNYALSDFQIKFFSETLDLRQALCIYCSLISVVIILVLCCLFIYKIIKLVGGLIR